MKKKKIPSHHHHQQKKKKKRRGSEEEAVFSPGKEEDWQGVVGLVGDNVYVLDFKRFLPARKSRCKGVFLRLKDLTDFHSPSPPICSSPGRDGVTESGSASSHNA